MEDFVQLLSNKIYLQLYNIISVRLNLLNVSKTIDLTNIHFQVAPMGLIYLFMINFYKQTVPNGTFLNQTQ
jgi:hypothetical protein